MLSQSLAATRKTLRLVELILLFPLLALAIGPRKAAVMVLDEAGLPHDG